MIDKAQLEIETDLSVGDWIRESLEPWVMFSEKPLTIGIVLPKGYERYVLVRHRGPGDNYGGLGNETLSTLIEILSRFTSTPETCFHALWEGQGWMHPGGAAAFTRVRYPRLHKLLRPLSMRFRLRRSRKKMRKLSQSSAYLPENTLPVGIMSAERFKLPNRAYLLMRGALKEAKNIGWVFSDSFHAQSPNLIWPRDRAWIFVSEIDFNVTLIGGSKELIEKILGSERVVSQRFEITDTIEQLPIAEY